MTLIDRLNKWVVSLQFSAVAAALCCSISAAAQAEQPSKYRLVDLGLVGPAGQPFDITNNGIIAGAVGIMANLNYMMPMSMNMPR